MKNITNMALAALLLTTVSFMHADDAGLLGSGGMLGTGIGAEEDYSGPLGHGGILGTGVLAPTDVEVREDEYEVEGRPGLFRQGGVLGTGVGADDRVYEIDDRDDGDDVVVKTRPAVFGTPGTGILGTGIGGERVTVERD